MSETPKAICRVEGWTYHETLLGRARVLSAYAVYDHPLIPDGAGLRATSEIIGKSGDLIETQNTLYELGKWSGYGPDREALFKVLEGAAS